MNKILKITIVWSSFLLLLGACEEPQKPKKEKKPTAQKPKVEPLPPPEFNADSAYKFIERQVQFGPRVPNTKAHQKCADYLVSTLESYDLKVIRQRAEVEAYNGKTLQIQNIIAQYDSANPNRVLLFAHWDSRPYADRDDERKAVPIDAANDGGSGVGVLLEIARAINNSEIKPRVGVDIVFFDAEDYGQPNATIIAHQSNTWCLGSQYWARNNPIPNYYAKYGILLDMVGAKDAVFPKEMNSMNYAPTIVNKVWSTAAKLGYSNYFIPKREFRGITDDHLYVNAIAGIPSIDIIHYRPDVNDFGSFHHTHDDTMDIIHKPTLHAVGHTVLTVIYSE
ncbi:MAG: M28 family peptidase [Flavobacteriales bacterium]|nr:M28 family peptidase [Flavobacteriales bacterium]